jgi:hypothetical protein
MRFIGDVHGGMSRYLQLIDGADESVQVGDFGIGFVRNPIEQYDVEKHTFIRGNHDWPQGCVFEPNWLPDGSVTVIPGTSDAVMYVGGAWSIDWAYRTEGKSWWRDEELSQSELDRIVEEYAAIKPKVMVTHEVPDFLPYGFGIKIYDVPSRTREAFGKMFAVHQPKVWLAGHWHLKFDRVINDCRFVVLDCDSYIDIDITGDCRENEQQTLSKYHYL